MREMGDGHGGFLAKIGRENMQRNEESRVAYWSKFQAEIRVFFDIQGQRQGEEVFAYQCGG